MPERSSVMPAAAFDPTSAAERLLSYFRRNPNPQNWEFWGTLTYLCDLIKATETGPAPALALVEALDALMAREDRASGGVCWNERRLLERARARVQDLACELTPTAELLVKSAS